MQIRSSPFFFFTTTGLETQRGYTHSLIRPFSSSFSTSLLIALFFSGANLRGFCLTDGKLGSMFCQWQVCAGSILCISSWDHVKTSSFRFRNSNISFFCSSGNRAPSRTTFAGSASFSRTATSSSIVDSGLSDSSLICFIYAGRRSFDCYSSLVEALAFASTPLRAVEKHFLAEAWSPLMSIV
ncbi:hypothetical protein PanWU01x14_297330 [Parasponia andersonii]|uniref:Uncharacterized protein n=1 Tax=Parasponia andersonii TaxID=3476 RepID=A0A2P5AV45_PARAD|nr:hypothetical protein PanWU01x14_297330 [Parasponia andersonii]